MLAQGWLRLCYGFAEGWFVWSEFSLGLNAGLGANLAPGALYVCIYIYILLEAPGCSLSKETYGEPATSLHMPTLSSSTRAESEWVPRVKRVV